LSKNHRRFCLRQPEDLADYVVREPCPAQDRYVFPQVALGTGIPERAETSPPGGEQGREDVVDGVGGNRPFRPATTAGIAARAAAA
jgi:hypothetical protein